MPAHHDAEAYLNAHLYEVGISEEKKTPLFRSIDRNRKFTYNPLHRTSALLTIKC